MSGALRNGVVKLGAALRGCQRRCAARRAIATLGDGDGLNRVRDAAGLRRRIVTVEDSRGFDDIDTEAELAARIARG